MSASSKAFCLVWNTAYSATLLMSLYLHDAEGVKTALVALLGYWCGRLHDD
jgi:hypothetical protein